MPIDPMFADAILGTFRNMSKEIAEKGISGENVDTMNIHLSRMEQLAQELDDLDNFNAAMMRENLYMNFSDYYGRALSGNYSNTASPTVYDDAADQHLLKQSLDAYKKAIVRLRKAKEETIANVGVAEAKHFNDDLLIKPIQDVIDLGESGINFATFLRLMIERGLDKAMEGAIVTRDALIFTRDYYIAAKINPHYEAREIERVETYDKMSAAAKFGVPSNLKFNLAGEVIDVKYEIPMKKWDQVKDRFERILGSLDEWATSYCSFAPQVQPWSFASSPRAAVKETQDCNPGDIHVQLEQLNRYHGMSFHDIFKHETFLWEVEYHSMWYSQEHILFLRDEVFTHCKPGNHLPSNLVSKMADHYQNLKQRNPSNNKVMERYVAFHDGFFGAGYWASKYDMPVPYKCNAAPWDLSTFN